MCDIMAKASFKKMVANLRLPIYRFPRKVHFQGNRSWFALNSLASVQIYPWVFFKEIGGKIVSKQTTSASGILGNLDVCMNGLVQNCCQLWHLRTYFHLIFRNRVNKKWRSGTQPAGDNSPSDNLLMFRPLSSPSTFPALNISQHQVVGVHKSSPSPEACPLPTNCTLCSAAKPLSQTSFEDI